MKLTCIFFLSLLATACSLRQPERMVSSDNDTTSYHERYRPRFHFTPAKHWTNDPNGLVYFNGAYHLFYQYNPYAAVWGHMSWGHAVSADLLHWKHLPVAIDEYIDRKGDSTMVFSGSAVADPDNTSGFFNGDSAGMVAIYTSHVHRTDGTVAQHQSIAWSGNNGRTFSRYDKNPVLDIGRKDFRDPKVFWYAPEKKWVMVAVIPDRFKVHLYESRNLKEWTFMSEFGPLGDTSKIWECPDLSEVNVVNEPGKKKWLLLISGAHPQRAAFVGMQYFVGNFDGEKFTVDDANHYPRYLEYGKDFYAAITYNNIPAPDGRTILIGWANNWAYAQKIPTDPWRSAMTLPRELSLTKSKDGYRVIQKPVRELASLRTDTIAHLDALTGKDAFEIEYEFTGGTALQSGIRIFRSEKEETIIGYDRQKQEVFFDRSVSGNVSFHPDFASLERAPATLIDGKLKLHIFVDHSIIEVFINDGENVITDQVFPVDALHTVELFSTGGEASVTVKGWLLRSTWE